MTMREPSEQLIKKYCDYIELLDSSKFSSLFRKYEKFFFNSKCDNAWKSYEPLLINEKWWSVAPYYFKEFILNKSERFYKLNPKILKSLLTNQLNNIPNSLISREIEIASNIQDLNEDSQVLKIFLSNSYYIEEARDKEFFTTVIKEQAELYFASSEFIDVDCKQLSLKPSYVEYAMYVPRQLALFYYIELINIYWIQVLKTQAEVAGFYFYDYWLEYLMKKAPILQGKQDSEIPNYFILAAKRIFNNVSLWINHFYENQNENTYWACNHFIELKLKLIDNLKSNFSNKFEYQFLIDLLVNYFEECIKLHGISFTKKIIFPSFEKIEINFKKDAFNELTKQNYVLASELKNPHYIWLKKALKIN